MAYILSATKTGVTVEMDDGTGTAPLTTYEEVIAVLQAEADRLGIDLDDLSVFVSSSMDFPEEYTDNPAVLELVHSIR